MQQQQAPAGYRLSPQQRRAWQLQQESRACRAQCAVLIEGRLDREALRGALGAIVGRHEILRTTFHRQPGRRFPLQVIAAGGAPAWREAEPVGPDEQAGRRLEALYRAERGVAFDLQSGPLLHATLITETADRHVLLLSLPALCADARTLHNLLEEAGRSYAALAGQGFDAAVGADEVTQYVQFSEWQHELLEEDDDQTARRHWRELDLASASTLTLPSEAAAPVQTPFDVEAYAFTLDAAVAAEVRRVAAGQGTSVGTLMLACWSALVWRLTRQSGIVVGVSADGRMYEELRGACGLFAKVVPVGLHVEDVPFSQLVRQVDQRWRDAYAFQEYFTWEAAAVEHPFAAVGFAYEERPERFSAAGASFSLLRQDVCTERFKVRLTCAQTGEALAAEIHFDPRHLPAAEAERLAEQFHALSKAAAANPSALVGDLEITGPEERRQLLFAFNDTRAEFPGDECLHGLFEQQAARSPEATALVFRQQRRSYRELNAEANRLAHHLRKNGVGPEVRVGLCVERSAEMIVGMLGILKAGGAYVPLDAEHPQASLSHQLAETEAPVLVTQQKLLGSLPPFGGKVVCLDTDAALFADEPDTDPAPNAVAQNLAYVIYTSGSTGTPKGVAVTHRNLVNYTDFICRQLRLHEPADGEPLSFATVSTIGADLGNTCIFPALASGGCLHVLGYETATDAGRLADYAAAHPIDVLKIVPSHLRQLLLADDGARLLPRRYLITGGEALGLGLARRIGEMTTGCRLLNHYGPTETTVGSVVNLDVPKALAAPDGGRDSSPQRAADIPIGRAIANTSVYVLDEKSRLVPRGVVGEIHIGGEGVARGYLRQGGLTAERFVPDPFSGAGGRRMYRTGDLGRYLPDGSLEFLGRVDGQVKVRGYRIELGEIESALLQHEAVRQAAVIVQQGDAGQPRLVAFVEAGPERRQTATGDRHAQTVSAEELRRHLRQRLPDYMLPAAFVTLDRLPLTPNGKLDRRALAPLAARAGQPTGTYLAPRTPAEQLLAAIWHDVLRLRERPVGIDDNFFELGGDSILSIQVMARANQAGLRLTPRQLFEHPTIAALAEVATLAAARHRRAGRGERRGAADAHPAGLLRPPRGAPAPLEHGAHAGGARGALHGAGGGRGAAGGRGAPRRAAAAVRADGRGLAAVQRRRRAARLLLGRGRVGAGAGRAVG